MRHRRSFFATVVRSPLIWVCAPFVIAGGICLSISLRLCWLEWQYHSAAQETLGTVLQKWRSTDPHGSFGGTAGSRGAGSTRGGVNYTIRYQYRPVSGPAREDQDDVSASYWEQLQPGGSLKVFYLPKLPNHSRLWIGIRAFVPAILFLVGAPMTFLGLMGEVFIVADLRKKYHKAHTVPSMRPG